MTTFSSTMREFAPYMYVGWEILVVVLACTGGGYFADKWLGTAPWLTVAFALFGVAGAMVIFLRVAGPLTKR